MKYWLCIIFSLVCFKAQAESSDWKFYQKHGHKSKNWNEWVEKGFLAYESQDCGSTISYLTQAIQNNCQDALVYFKLAVCSEATGSAYTAEQYYLLAETALGKLKTPHPYQQDIFENIGRLFYTQKKFKKALSYLSKAEELGRPSFLVLFLLAQQAMQDGADAKALEYYERMVQLNESGILQVPKDKLGIAYQSLALHYFNQKDIAKAELLLNKAAALLGKNNELAQLETKISLIKQQGKLIENLQKLESKTSGKPTN